jgi:hypothetical protein
MSDALRQAMEAAIQRRDALVKQLDEALAENEQLKTALREYACTGTDHPCGCYNQFLSERAEIEQLRGVIYRNCDPMTATREDEAIINEAAAFFVRKEEKNERSR